MALVGNGYDGIYGHEHRWSGVMGRELEEGGVTPCQDQIVANVYRT